MINRLFLSFVVSIYPFFSVVYSQTGPAGVGTNTTSVNQIRFWVKADVAVFNDAGTTLASNTNLVQQWNDQSGLANNAIQLTAARKPRYITNAVNGLPALRFVGTTFITATAFPGIANNVGYTYIVVFKDTSFVAGTQGDGAGDYIIDRGLPGAEANELCSFKVSNTNRYGFQKRDGGGGGLGGPVSTSTVNTASYQIINYRQIPGATKVYDLFVDGTLETTVSSADANYVPPVPQIGHHYQPALGGMKGYIAEVLVYNYNLNNAQIHILNSHLAAKYGLTVANDKYAGDTPANGNYDFEVAGIGREASATAINTTSSSSVSGGLEATQGGVTFENNEYLVYGHQSGANGMNFSDIGGMSAGSWVGRWERIWYLDFTHIGGTDETVNLTFDISDGGMGSPTAATASNYKLLYRSGLSGSWTESAIVPTLSGDRITFSGLVYNTFGDGYYTIGTLDNAVSPLPIELLRFSAIACGNEVCVEWTTASESSNDYFTIEKTLDGINYIPFVTLNGAGNSTSVLNYSTKDNTPFDGMSFYRLKQTDFDGNHSYSHLEKVIFADENATSFELLQNPSDGTLIDVLISGREDEMKIVINDALGKDCGSTTIRIKNASQERYSIAPCSRLASGVYYVTATSKNQFFYKKLIVK